MFSLDKRLLLLDAASVISSYGNLLFIGPVVKARRGGVAEGLISMRLLPDHSRVSPTPPSPIISQKDFGLACTACQS